MEKKEKIREIATVGEISKILKISPVAVRSLLRKGILEGFRVDSRFRIFVDSLPQNIFKEKV